MTAQRVKIIFNSTQNDTHLHFNHIPHVGEKVGIDGTIYTVTHVWHIFKNVDQVAEVVLYLSESL